ncbi:MAG: hypothetical protein ICV60_12360 [Pyrinomonadaceae bacterium]|nr:hypothetical protein [Pyrinomonadaceae bacterium]
MKRVKTVAALVVAALIILTALPCASFSSSYKALAAQDSTSALERGWRTGYSDGYQAGYGDSSENAPRDFKGKEDYRRADRAYAATYGPREDYRDGYQQGFEIGYNAGYERKGFDSTVPAGLKRRGAVQNSAQTSSPPVLNDDSDDSSSSSSSSSNPVNVPATSGTRTGTIFIPRDTIMRVELLTNLSTEASQEGDRFQARVVEPAEFQGAMIDGRVTKVKRPGRVKGNSELQLSFEQIRMDNRFANLNAQVVEVIDTPGAGGNGTGDVDSEGGVKGKDDSKRDAVKIGTSAAIGAIIGAIAGGGKGAAIGAAIGGAIGTGGVLTQRGRDIYLPQGQQLRIRTNSDTRIP